MKDGSHQHGLHAGQAPHGGEGSQGGDDVEIIAQGQVEVAGHFVADGHPGRIVGAAGGQLGKGPLLHLQGLGSAGLDGLQVQSPHHPAGNASRRGEHDLGVNKRGRGHYPGNPPDALRQLLIVRDAGPPLQHDDVGVDAQNLVFQVLTEAGHHPDDHDEDHDPHRHAGGGN